MSVRALAWAVQTEAPCAASKLVLICLANYADERGECWPTMPKLARDSQLPEAAVQDHLGKLLDAQLITIRPYAFDRKKIFALILPRQ
jgi:DNA-binding MarR family transcriptional regulator